MGALTSSFMGEHLACRSPPDNASSPQVFNNAKKAAEPEGLDAKDMQDHWSVRYRLALLKKVFKVISPKQATPTLWLSSLLLLRLHHLLSQQYGAL